MYRNATDFSVLTSYPATLLNLSMVQIVIFLIFMVFDSISAEMIFLPLFQIWCFLLFFMPDCTGWDFQYCAGQKWWKRTSFSPAWVRGKALCLSPLGMMFAVVVNIQFLLRWDNFPLFLVRWTFLPWKDVGFRQIISLHQLRRSCVCSSFEPDTLHRFIVFLIPDAPWCRPSSRFPRRPSVQLCHRVAGGICVSRNCAAVRVSSHSCHYELRVFWSADVWCM